MAGIADVPLSSGEFGGTGYTKAGCQNECRINLRCQSFVYILNDGTYAGHCELWSREEGASWRSKTEHCWLQQGGAHSGSVPSEASSGVGGGSAAGLEHELDSVVLNEPDAAQCVYDDKTDYFGSDVASFTAADPADCARLCLGSEECEYFTFANWGTCYLKDSGAGRRAAEYGTSGRCPRRTVVYQINSGGPTLTSAAGTGWVADTAYVHAQHPTSTFASSGAGETGVYQTERFAVGGIIRYTLPVYPGLYLVRLHFTENWSKKANARVMAVKIGNTVVLPALDIFMATNGVQGAPLVLSYYVRTSIHKLAIQLESVKNNAKINALEVIAVEEVPHNQQGGSLARHQRADIDPVRVNCGDPKPFVDSDGNRWAPDVYYKGGKTRQTRTIRTQKSMFTRERYTKKGFVAYKIPAKKKQMYKIRMHLVSGPQPTYKLIDIMVNKKLEFSRFDSATECGLQQYCVKEFIVFNTYNTMTIKIVKVKGQPAINGLEVLPVAATVEHSSPLTWPTTLTTNTTTATSTTTMTITTTTTTTIKPTTATSTTTMTSTTTTTMTTTTTTVTTTSTLTSSMTAAAAAAATTTTTTTTTTTSTVATTTTTATTNTTTTTTLAATAAAATAVIHTPTTPAAYEAKALLLGSVQECPERFGVFVGSLNRQHHVCGQGNKEMGTAAQGFFAWDNSWGVYIVSVDSNASRYFVNGSLKQTQQTRSGGTGDVWIPMSTAAVHGSLQVAEMVVYEQELTVAQLDRIDRQLQEKYFGRAQQTGERTLSSLALESAARATTSRPTTFALGGTEALTLPPSPPKQTQMFTTPVLATISVSSSSTSTLPTTRTLTTTATTTTATTTSTLTTTTSTITNKITGPRWLMYPELPVPVGELASVVHKNSLFVFGGKVGEPLEFDIVQGKWLYMNRSPRQFPGSHHAAITFGNKILLFGGFGLGSWGKVQIFKPDNPVMTQWTLGTKIPYGDVGSVSAVVIGKFVYVCGGLSSAGTHRDCSRYSPASNKWSYMANMVYAVNHAAAGTDGAKLYIFGGRKHKSNVVVDGTRHMQVYDPTSNAWGMGPTLPYKNAGMGCAAFLDGLFYVIGGETKTQKNLATADMVMPQTNAFNPKTSTWSKRQEMPIPAHGICPVADHKRSRLYVAGGDSKAGTFGNEGSTMFQVYQLELATPTTQPPPAYVPPTAASDTTPVTTSEAPGAEVNIICFPCNGTAKFTTHTVLCSDKAAIRSKCAGVCGHSTAIAQCM